MYITIFSILIILLDQITKFLIRNGIIQRQKITNYLYLTFVKNKGAAFGILSGQRILFILVTVFFLFFIIYIYQKELRPTFINKTAVSFLIGGSIANFIDRLFLHYVTDFIAFDLFDFYSLPVINIADIFIFIGVVILIYQLLISKNRGV